MIAPFDCASMAEKIDELLKNCELLQKMAENTLMDFERFQDASILYNWRQVIESVMNQTTVGSDTRY